MSSVRISPFLYHLVSADISTKVSGGKKRTNVGFLCRTYLTVGFGFPLALQFKVMVWAEDTLRKEEEGTSGSANLGGRSVLLLLTEDEIAADEDMAIVTMMSAAAAAAAREMGLIFIVVVLVTSGKMVLCTTKAVGCHLETQYNLLLKSLLFEKFSIAFFFSHQVVCRVCEYCVWLISPVAISSLLTCSGEGEAEGFFYSNPTNIGILRGTVTVATIVVISAGVDM